MNFRDWLKRHELKLQELSTGTNSVATFAQPVLFSRRGEGVRRASEEPLGGRVRTMRYNRGPFGNAY